MIVGSPSYMSPEQARGQTDVDARSDLYSLGAIMFECLTGRLPFEAPNFNDLLFQVVLEDAPHPLEFKPDLDPMFAAIVSRAMRRDRDARFQSAHEFREAIRTWQEKPKGVEASSAGLRVVSQVVPAVRRDPVRRENPRPPPEVPPPAALATPPSKPGGARKGMLLLATLVVIAIGGAASWRARVRPTAARPPTTRASVAPPPPAPTPPPVAPPPSAPDPSTAVIASPPDPPPAARPSRPAPWVPRPRAASFGPKPVASSPSAVVAPTSSAAPPAPAPPADPAADTTVTKRPVTVEGRTIRTDL
jgi:serine/threonine-protein kinase